MGVVIVGDSRHLPTDRDERPVILAERDASLAEVIARQLPRIEPADAISLQVILGTRDLQDGYDESYIHAHLVQLLDSVMRIAPDARVVVHGFPPVAPDLDAVRKACEAAGEITAALRGMSWVQNPRHPPRDQVQSA